MFKRQTFGGYIFKHTFKVLKSYGNGRELNGSVVYIQISMHVHIAKRLILIL